MVDLSRLILTVVCVLTLAASRPAHAETYLLRLADRYMDEVDTPRSPERSGIIDVVVEVIPPWEE